MPGHAAAGTALALAAALAAAGCDNSPPEPARKKGEPEPITVDVPQTVVTVAPGTTPMAERVAVIGLLNKRNGISRDLTMKPGEAFRVGDVIVRLRACETTAPWEEQKLTGAFLQLDVRNPQDQFQRVFSGWLYKESPSLNVVEHPIYDVWPKSCTMTHPEEGESTVRAGSAASSRSRAPNSTGSRSRAPSGPGPAAGATSPPIAPTKAPSGAASDSADDSKAR
jgi:hypothetical protein